MPIVFTKGDIFETDGIRAYAFGAQLDGSMDSGLASAVAKRWPELATAYAEHTKGGSVALGDVFVWKHEDLTVFALTIHQGDKSSLSALTRAVRRMLALAAEGGIKRIGIPRIGAGPGGLDWTRVRKVLSEISVGQPVRLDVFEQFVRAKSA